MYKVLNTEKLLHHFQTVVCWESHSADDPRGFWNDDKPWLRVSGQKQTGELMRFKGRLKDKYIHGEI